MIWYLLSHPLFSLAILQSSSFMISLDTEMPVLPSNAVSQSASNPTKEPLPISIYVTPGNISPSGTSSHGLTRAVASPTQTPTPLFQSTAGIKSAYRNRYASYLAATFNISLEAAFTETDIQLAPRRPSHVSEAEVWRSWSAVRADTLSQDVWLPSQLGCVLCLLGTRPIFSRFLQRWIKVVSIWEFERHFYYIFNKPFCDPFCVLGLG